MNANTYETMHVEIYIVKKIARCACRTIFPKWRINHQPWSSLTKIQYSWYYTEVKCVADISNLSETVATVNKICIYLAGCYTPDTNSSTLNNFSGFPNGLSLHKIHNLTLQWHWSIQSLLSMPIDDQCMCVTN